MKLMNPVFLRKQHCELADWRCYSSYDYSDKYCKLSHTAVLYAKTSKGMVPSSSYFPSFFQEYWVSVCVQLS